MSREGPHFTEVTDSAGLGGFRHATGARGEKWFPETMGSGAAFLDYDEDGRLDILLAGGGYWGEPAPSGYAPLVLYRNTGGGSYARVRADSVLPDLEAYTFGLAVADYDGDGDSDVFVTTLGRDLLLENVGGRFRERGSEAGVAGPDRWSTASAFLDYDRDGDLDLYVGGYAAWSPASDVDCRFEGELEYCHPDSYEDARSRFYENRGDGSFRERTSEVLGTAPGKVLGAVTFDYDRDGWTDLAVARDLERNLLYTNRSDGRFEEQGLQRGLALSPSGEARAGMGTAAGVVDTTGRTTLFVGNFSREQMGVFRYEPTGLFVDRAGAAGLASPTRPTLTFGLELLDVEGDGDLDLVAANGHIQQRLAELKQGISFRQAPQLFLNDGTGRFSEADTSAGAIWGRPLLGRGLAEGDYDGDGDPDLLMTENGGGARLLRNDGSGGRYLCLVPVGAGLNTDAVGLEVRVLLEDRWRRYGVEGGGSYLSASTHRLAIGTGESGGIDSLVLEWPSGRTDRFGAREAGTSWRVVEESGAIEPLGPQNRSR